MICNKHGFTNASICTMCDCADQYMYVADWLDKAQAAANKGRGISVVQTIVFYLRQGDINRAQAVSRNDSDKLWQYPEIRKYVHDNLEPIGYWDEDTHQIIK